MAANKVHSSVPSRAALDGVVQCLACSVCAHCWSGGTACVARSFILSHHATLAADEANAGSVMNMRLSRTGGKTQRQRRYLKPKHAGAL